MLRTLQPRCRATTGRMTSRACMPHALTARAHPIQTPATLRQVACHATQPDRAAHNRVQLEIFGNQANVQQFTEAVPEEIHQRLRAIVESVPGLGEASRVIDVGSGTGVLIPHLQERGVKDILAVDLSEPMLTNIKAKYTRVGTLGNDLGVRTWLGDVVDLPAYQGGADAFMFNAVFGNLFSPRDALLKAALMTKPGGHLVVSHPMGRRWHAGLKAKYPDMVPHELPDRQSLEAMLSDLPLQLVDFRDEEQMYLAVMQVPPHYAYKGGLVRLGGKVVTGFGRGSKQMGTPTANIDPGPLQGALSSMPRGVYFGWGRIMDAPASWPDADKQVHKIVMNVGRRPTVNTGDEAATVEAHIMHPFTGDFYGKELHVVAVGYIRPEMRFPGGLPELIARIKADVALSSLQLDTPELQAHARDQFLQ